MIKYEDFLKRTVKRKREPTDAIPLISPSGDLTEIKGVDAILRSIINILLIPHRTYIFDPEMGCGIYRYVFEPFDKETENNLKNEIRSVINRYETRASIDVDVVPLDGKPGFVIILTIKYEGETKQVTLSIDEDVLKTLPPIDTVNPV